MNYRFTNNISDEPTNIYDGTRSGTSIGSPRKRKGNLTSNSPSRLKRRVYNARSQSEEVFNLEPKHYRIAEVYPILRASAAQPTYAAENNFYAGLTASASLKSFRSQANPRRCCAEFSKSVDYFDRPNLLTRPSRFPIVQGAI